MKRFKHNFKKGMAFVLSLVMVAGLVLAMSGGANKVQAASGSGTKPSVSAYATKTQLMDGTFAPNADGTAVNYGKIVFGKKSDGTTEQEWYILGKDKGVLGDNTIIFAASPIATGQKFNSSESNKSFDSGFGVYASDPSEVYANHYGASELRVALQRMATNPNQFTTAEQGLMNATTVKTEDTKNSNVTYITTDKLYALQGNYDYDMQLWAGTSDSTVLAMSSYWSSGDLFWLRSPYASNDNRALHANPGIYVNSDRVDRGYAVQPASNLKLSSVLFASAAKAASSATAEVVAIASNKAMTLRLDGTGRDIGTVTYNATTGDIKVVRGTASQPVSLVLQGNDGTRDWYYSKQITGTETITASDINLSACKIWLETTDSTDNLTYAVNATETVDSDISSVAITGIDTPTANTTLDTSATCATTGVSSTTPQITWTPSDTTAGYNTSYTASITLTADTGYKFVDSTTATINGNTATSVTKNADGTLTVTYAFPATAVLTATEPTLTMGNYQIIDGANGKHTIGKDGTLTFRSNAPFSEFVAVLVDGVRVDPSNYDVSEGSTIVRLKQSFLDTLSKGSHTIAIQSIGGTATTNFSVAETPTPSTPTAGITNVQPNGGTQKTTVNAKAPVTGETSPVSCMVLALIIVGGFALLIAELRKAHKA